MRSLFFTCIKKYINYIPRCLICNKEMQLYIQGTERKTFWRFDCVYIKTCISDNLLISKSKKYPLIIDINDNRILTGNEIISAIDIKEYSVVYLNKTCSTCKFIIEASYVHPPLNITNSINESSPPLCREDGYFPTVFLDQEELCYTRNRGKNISIKRQHYSQLARTSLTVDGKSVKCFDLDLSKFNNLNHLNSRISTLLTFQ